MIDELVMSGFQPKVGTFDWVIGFEEMRFVFDSKHTRIENPHDSKVFVVGCGTSDLSPALASIYGLVVSCDYDPEVIRHMSTAFVGVEKLMWLVHDMIQCYDNSSHSNLNPLLASHMYDIVVDKTSMDAMLVEGSVSKLFCEVHRLLKHNGVYILCSLHPPSLIQSFLALPSLQFNLEFCTDIMLGPSSKFGTIVICRKRNPGLLRLEEVEAEEENFMDLHFQTVDPWLTAEREDFIRCNCKSDILVLKEAHDLINLADPTIGYDYSLFTSDLKNFSLSSEGGGTISVCELIAFLKSMQ